MRAMIFETTGEWFRFDKYEVVPETKGRSTQFVRPADGACLKRYRPFEKFPQIIEEYSRLARELVKESKISRDDEVITNEEAIERFVKRESRYAARIVEFANRYGLLGILWQCRPQVDPTSGHKTVSKRGGKFDVKFFKDYQQVFVPNSLWSINLGGPYGPYPGVMKPEEFLRYFRVERFPISQVLSYSGQVLRAYSESVSDIANDARDFLRISDEVDRFREGGFGIDDAFDSRLPSLTWRKHLSSLTAISDVGLRLGFDKSGDHTIEYQFRSLVSAVRIMLIENAVAPPSGQVRTCVECGEPFKAKDGRGRFCSQSCSNRHRQREFQQRKRAMANRKGKRNGRKRSTAKKGR